MADAESTIVMERQHGADQMRMIADSVGRLLRANMDRLYGDLITVAIFGTFLLWTCNFGFFALSYFRKKWGLHSGGGGRSTSTVAMTTRRRSASSVASSATDRNLTSAGTSAGQAGEAQLVVDDGEVVSNASTENVVVDYRATGDGWGNGDENGLIETSSDFFLYVLNEEATAGEDDEGLGVYYTFLDEDEEDELQSALEDEERSLEQSSTGEAAVEDSSGVVINTAESFNAATERASAVLVNRSSHVMDHVTNTNNHRSSTSRHRISSSMLPGENEQQQQ